MSSFSLTLFLPWVFPIPHTTATLRGFRTLSFLYTSNNTMTTVDEKPEKYVRGVSFDAMTDKDLPNFSFTLRGKTPGYKRTRRTRTFMVATDLANYSEYALTWASDVRAIFTTFTLY